MTNRTSPAKPAKKHLLTAKRLDQASKIDHRSSLTRSRGESNGLRVHSVFFAALGLAVLIVAIIAIAIVSGMM